MSGRLGCRLFPHNNRPGFDFPHQEYNTVFIHHRFGGIFLVRVGTGRGFHEAVAIGWLEKSHGTRPMLGIINFQPFNKAGVIC